jgi:hypothetical protein
MTTPVFILGVAPRCGTNYLEDLLCVHPDVGLGIPLRENQLISTLPDLSRYVDDLAGKWHKNKRWGFQPEHINDLTRSLGLGLTDFMISQVDGRRRIQTPPDTLPGIEAAFKLEPRFLVTKHPRPTGLFDFRRFFPDAKLILLMRDGRAVAESSIRSWGWNFDVAVDNWRRGAADMTRFLDDHPDDPSLFVRYEDLITDPDNQIGRIFEYIGLDPEAFDFDRALKRPVRGSSTDRPPGADEVAWEPVEKTDDFDPLARARHWTPAQHARFNHMAGALLERFDYPSIRQEDGIVPKAQNVRRDILLLARNVTRPLRQRLERS